MRVYDLYGIRERDLEGVRAAIEAALGFQMELRENIDYGEYYLFRGKPELFTLHANQDEDGYPAEPNFAEYPLLFRIDGTSEGDEYRRKISECLPRVQFLRRDKPTDNVCHL